MSTSTPARPPFRLLFDAITDPFRHFAMEEALLRGVDEGTSPETLRQRRVSPSVWIGVFQVAINHAPEVLTPSIHAIHAFVPR